MEHQILDEGYRINTPEDDLELKRLKLKNKDNKILINLGHFSLFISVFLFIMAFSSHAAFKLNLGAGEGGLLKLGFLIVLFLFLLVGSYFNPKSSFFLASTTHLFLIIYQLFVEDLPLTSFIQIKFILVLLISLAFYGNYYFEKNKKRIKRLEGTN